MVIFHSYVSLPGGIHKISIKYPLKNGDFPIQHGDFPLFLKNRHFSSNPTRQAANVSVAAESFAVDAVIEPDPSNVRGRSPIVETWWA